VRAAAAGRVSRGLDEDAAHFIARPIAVARAYEQLAAQIKARILAGELAEGDRLPSEVAIGREARVSRSTVREALRLLEEAGFVERTSPRILVVARPRGEEPALRETARALRHSNVTFDDLVEALLALDPALTRLATARVDDVQIARLQAHLDEQARVLAEPETWSRLDDEFHVMIGEMSGNAPLLLARRGVSALLLPTMWRFVRDERMTRAAFTFHERIVEQIRARDPEAAAFMTRKHIDDFRRAWERAGLDVHHRIGEPG
jgi:GntR family transcriptional repressor for pyruvate dehydrogenase complex